VSFTAGVLTTGTYLGQLPVRESQGITESMRIIGSALMLAVVAASSPALAAPTVRQPTGNWLVNFDDAQCVASRNFGTKEDPLFLVLKAPAVGDVVQVAVMRSGRGGIAQQLDGSVAFGGREPVSTSVLAFTSGPTRQRVFTINLAKTHFAAAGSATTMSVRGADQLNETFALDKVDSLMKVMDECVADLRQVWNVSTSPEASSNLKQRATIDGIGRLFSYPDVAVRRNQQGGVRFVLLIDEEGRVADCTVVETSGIAALDAQSCSTVKEKARFTPAIGNDGQPAKDSYTRRVSWRIPD
jgi:TonB family protein